MLGSLKEFLERNLARDDTPDSTDSSQRLELSAAVLMVEISLADASIDDAELAVIQNALSAHFHIPTDRAQELITLAQQEVDLAVSLHSFTRLLNEQLSPPEKIQIIELLWRVAFADTRLSKYEEYHIRKIADLLYISHKDFIRTKHQAAQQDSC